MEYKFLVVDDEKEVRDMVIISLERAKLEGADIEFDEAENGKVALAKLDENKYDLVILDLMMPIVDGETVLRAIRDNPETSELPVIIFTSIDGNKSLMALFKAKCNYYITKPFFPTQLISAIELILGVGIVGMHRE